MITWVKKHWVLSVLFVIAIISVYMAAMKYKASTTYEKPAPYSAEEANQ